MILVVFFRVVNFEVLYLCEFLMKTLKISNQSERYQEAIERTKMKRVKRLKLMEVGDDTFNRFKNAARASTIRSRDAAYCGLDIKIGYAWIKSQVTDTGLKNPHSG